MLDDLGAKQVESVAENIAAKSAALQTQADSIVSRCTERKTNIETAFAAIPV